jgi:replicative DNA helicase
MNIKIAISDSYKYKIKNKEYTYDEFKKYLLGFKPISISFKNEDNKEFEEALKECMKNHKDKINGFVGGQFSKNNSERIDENLSYRSLIVLDVDEYNKGLDCLKKDIKEELGKYKYLAYSTIGHTPEKPKIRIILFPNQDIEKTEYRTISSNFIAKLSFKKAIDEASTKPNQFMLISVKPEFNALPEGLNYTYTPWSMENEQGELVKIEEYAIDSRVSNKAIPNDDDFNEEAFRKTTLSQPIILNDEQVLEYLKFCEPKSADYNIWLTVGQALHHQYRRENKGKEIWKDWSEQYKASNDNIDKIDTKWKSFKDENKESLVSMLSIIKLYKKNGLQMKSIEELKNEIKQDQESNQGQPLDINKYRKRIYEIQKHLLEKDIGTSEKIFKNLKDILSNINKYNDLLTINYEQDKPYTYASFLADIQKKPAGLKTGFESLDNHVTIQPASLVFIAGRPSHGKTMTMLNLYRNMIEANPDKAFLFYSYEENKDDILLKIILGNIELEEFGEGSIILEKEEGTTFFDKARNHLRKYALTVETQKDGTINALDNRLNKAFKKVEQWVSEGRLQILDKKAKVEILSSAIIERVKASEKPVAAIFIDYVQKLNTEEERVNRQQEVQRICQSILNTALDERVNAAIILGAQVNRDVKSLDSFTLDNMREAGDIEQDANLVLGIWDEQAGKLDSLHQKLETINNKIDDTKYGIKNEDLAKSEKSKENIENEIKASSNTDTRTGKVLKVKVLKNRNGRKDVVVELESYPSRFLIKDMDIFDKKSINEKIKSLS